MFKSFIAHIKKNPDDSWAEPHLLTDHLVSTAKLASRFAEEFKNSDWAELIGLLHDLGKYHPDWQKYIRKETGYFDEDAHIEGHAGRPNHSAAGAIFLFEKFNNSPMAKVLAYAIAGHHTGLPDYIPQLTQRIFNENGKLITEDLDKIKSIEETKQFLEKPTPKSNPPFSKNNIVDNEQIHLWIRMLFSCLVDADFLDTEKYMDEKERGGYLSIEELKMKFDEFMNQKKPDSELNKKRNEILNQCREKANLGPGFFSLTVPTGGGKTLSSMAFALEHAIKHKKKRIIVAIPYTSIIEQTAEVFRSVFGDDQVVEHHSNLDPEKENHKNRLASENWDAPIIVTTNVQLFESLLGNKTSVCRKLHNIVNSVIILDEAQMIPTHYLKPILSVLKGLVNNFGVTVLSMSATQPALTGKIGSAPNIIDGLENVTEIIDEPDELSKNFKRVNFIIPQDFNKSETWDEIAEKLQQHDQVLCIVNKRDDCRALHKLMPEGTIHLSGYMCGEERSEVISHIKTKLKNNEQIRVISTQLVEAGVDIDFPVVYRALTGLDSIAQAAGRCNRENKIAEGGKVYVFIPPAPSPQGYLRKSEDAGKAILRNFKGTEFTPSLYSEYFNYLYSGLLSSFGEKDYHDHLIKDANNFEFQFKEYAEKFNMIDDKKQMSIIVRYKNSTVLIDQLKFAGASKELLRKLQRYIVNVPIYTFNKIREANYIEEINGYWVQSDENLYKPGLGLMVNEKDWTYGDGVI
ncbi:MAG: CRISPR-associated helicase Cas3' [Ignavibacterium album]|uniref:CRISPR-associated helicase Cas3' n=1 Tax=Ignavibacterium album TaxID=591197 RepID=UPI0026ED24E5|nr:CRISPR-associated helicase Cas3' [Ignavibacterium album]MCX8105779.1 CRISPR-associated helicase Cas3' [Ignavibacterium album]